jgi:CTP:molybdopterin cytidylyltransferase MocA
MTVAAMIVAAGASRRLGQPKQLVKYRGETLLGRAVRLALEAGASPVIAVLGANFELICASVALNGAVTVVNEKWETGIAGSIHAGLGALNALAPEVEGVLILSCDQPRLTAEHLRALMDTFDSQGQPIIVASFYAGTRGVPAVFPRAYFSELRALRGDKGARALLKEPTGPLIAIDFEGGEVDVDVPADLEQLG